MLTLIGFPRQQWLHERVSVLPCTYSASLSNEGVWYQYLLLMIGGKLKSSRISIRCKIVWYLMFIGPCIIVMVEEWKTNLMSLAILFRFLCVQHVSDINISIISSLRLCCWITTSVVLFCKGGWFSVSVNLRCIALCVWCDVFCRFVVVGRRILIDIDRYLLCFVITVFVCVWYFSLVVW
jgi:hypothetical protein